MDWAWVGAKVWAGPLLVAAAAALSSVPDGCIAQGTASPERGKTLFNGGEPLLARIREHDDAMPASVVVCAGCHSTHPTQSLAGSDAPPLFAAFLNHRSRRRQGPPSAYDERSFCRAVRTGVDPVFIQLDRSMPIYELSDAQCQSLWQYLQGQNDEQPPQPAK